MTRQIRMKPLTVFLLSPLLLIPLAALRAAESPSQRFLDFVQPLFRPSFPISRLGMPVSPKLRFAKRGSQQRRSESIDRLFWCPRLPNRRFEDKCVPNREIGNEEGKHAPRASS